MGETSEETQRERQGSRCVVEVERNDGVEDNRSSGE